MMGMMNTMQNQMSTLQNQLNNMGGCSANSSFAADGMSGQQNFMNQTPPIQQSSMQQFGGANGLMGENSLGAGGNQFGGCQQAMPGMQAGYGAIGQTFQHQAGPY